MLEVRFANDTRSTPVAVASTGGVVAGLREDTEYLLDAPGALPTDRVLVDDVPLLRGPQGFCWRPAFYAGRVRVELRSRDTLRGVAWLDVAPAEAKADEDTFAAMVGEVRAFDATLLSGMEAATLTFGRHGRDGRYANDIALSRIREYGPALLATAESIIRSPHRGFSSEFEVLPLSRVRRLRPQALVDRRIAGLITGTAIRDDDVDTTVLRSSTSVPTFDTPANRVLVALLRRMAAIVAKLETAVRERRLGAPLEQQEVRVALRLEDLSHLASRIRALLTRGPLRDVTRAGLSSAGLTQVAASPRYARAHRFGSRALATGIEGETRDDLLHVGPSWGIYESWCYVTGLAALERVLGTAARQIVPSTVHADLAHRFDLPGEVRLDVHLQATFSALAPSAHRRGWSISRERRPDILLCLHRGSEVRSLVLDAKWRSGRENVMAAMESAHIYHDALRIDGRRPDYCVLLLPGTNTVSELETAAYLNDHSVGAMSEVRVGGAGVGRLDDLLRRWIAENEGVARSTPGGR